jgi:integrase
LTPEVKALLEGARGDRLEALYVVALCTGLRRGEVLGLKSSDIDLEGGRLSVKRSRSSRRTLKLTTRALAALGAHKARQNEERLRKGDGWQDNDLVLPNTLGKPMNAGNFFRRNFQPLLERAGLANEGFTFHSLRHTFATTLAAEGVHPSTAQTMLGHSDIRMTLAIYTHATDDMQDAAIAALESALS